MNYQTCPKNNRSLLHTPPYSELHIYYLEGRLASSSTISSRHFIGNWEEDEYSFLFFSEPCPETIEELLKSQPDLTLVDKYHMTYEQWLGEKCAAFKAGSFLIVPPWDEKSASENDIKILLDPGLVFGTGAHPTTKNCLFALEFIYGQKTVRSAIDLGSGTGLLSLAAAKLGSETVLAVDINHLAAKTAVNNVRLNALEKRIRVICGKAEEWIDRPAELLIANLHYDVVKQLVDTEGFFDKEWFIISGLFRSQARKVENVLSQRRVNIVKTWKTDDVWHTICGKTA